MDMPILALLLVVLSAVLLTFYSAIKLSEG